MEEPIMAKDLTEDEIKEFSIKALESNINLVVSCPKEHMETGESAYVGLLDYCPTCEFCDKIFKVPDLIERKPNSIHRHVLLQCSYPTIMQGNPWKVKVK